MATVNPVLTVHDNDRLARLANERLHLRRLSALGTPLAPRILRAVGIGCDTVDSIAIQVDAAASEVRATISWLVDAGFLRVRARLGSRSGDGERYAIHREVIAEVAAFVSALGAGEIGDAKTTDPTC